MYESKRSKTSLVIWSIFTVVLGVVMFTIFTVTFGRMLDEGIAFLAGSVVVFIWVFSIGFMWLTYNEAFIVNENSVVYKGVFGKETELLYEDIAFVAEESDVTVGGSGQANSYALWLTFYGSGDTKLLSFDKKVVDKEAEKLLKGQLNRNHIGYQDVWNKWNF